MPYHILDLETGEYYYDVKSLERVPLCFDTLVQAESYIKDYLYKSKRRYKVVAKDLEDLLRLNMFFWYNVSDKKYYTENFEFTTNPNCAKYYATETEAVKSYKEAGLMPSLNTKVFTINAIAISIWG